MQNIKIPFEKDTGDMLNYDNWIKKENIEYKDNYIFFDTLEYDRSYKGRSTLTIYLRSTTQHNKYGENMEYSMFYTEFEKIILDGQIIGKGITGSWSFRKQGANYSLVYLGIQKSI